MFPGTANRFINSNYQSRGFSVRRPSPSRAFTGNLNVVRNGVIMDPFYRNVAERGGGSGRTIHLGTDITCAGGGNRGLTDPRRGQPVYAAISTVLQLDALSQVRAYDKRASALQTGLNLPATGVATLHDAQIAVQPWRSQDDGAYGGVVGFSCVYDHNNGQQFTLYIEFLHLITPDFLPRYITGTATQQEWTDTGRGIGFGPTIQSGMVPAAFIEGQPLVGYLGATQTPHVHVQAAFFPTRSFSHDTNLRFDPMVVVS